MAMRSPRRETKCTVASRWNLASLFALYRDQGMLPSLVRSYWESVTSKKSLHSRIDSLLLELFVVLRFALRPLRIQ